MSQNSSKKLNFQANPHHQEATVPTGEDCDEFGIADERFASPDCLQVFQTVDDNRKSIESVFPQQMLMLTSTDDNKVLAQCNNYDQIKKHLE